MDLTKTKELIIKYQETKDEKAFNELLMANMKLIYYFMNKFRYFNLTADELKSAGFYGFYKAVINYDYQRMPIKTFSTYLGNTIKNQMISEIRNCHDKFKRELLILDTTKKEDSEELIIDSIEGMNEEDVFKLATVEANRQIINELLSCLNSKQKQIIINRYGLDGCERKKLEELARMLNCSKQSISAEEHNALKKMRKKKIFRDIY